MPFFQILLGAHAQEKQNGTSFLVAALLPSHTGLVQPRIHLN